eukprot:1845095-Rhodomonas_salina.1
MHLRHNRPPAHQRVAAVRAVQPRQQLQRRRLPGPVVPQERRDLVGVEVNRQPVDCRQAPPALF